MLYAGSLVPEEVVAQAGEDAALPPRIVDTAPLDLDAIIDEMAAAHFRGCDVARVHSGDPSFYGAIGEQMRRLREIGIPYDVTPGVPAFAAAAAALRAGVDAAGRCPIGGADPHRGARLPDAAGRDARRLRHNRRNARDPPLDQQSWRESCGIFVPVCGADCPVVVLYRVSWPDQQIARGTLATIRAQMRGLGITRTALVLVGRALEPSDFADSRLYAPDHHHVLRPGDGAP